MKHYIIRDSLSILNQRYFLTWIFLVELPLKKQKLIITFCSNLWYDTSWKVNSIGLIIPKIYVVTIGTFNITLLSRTACVRTKCNYDSTHVICWVNMCG